MSDHLISGVAFPSTVRLSPAVVMLSNLRLFRETRPKESSTEDLSGAELVRAFDMRILD